MCFRSTAVSPRSQPAAFNNASVRVVFTGAISSLFLDSVTFSVPRVSIGGSCVGTAHLKTAFPDGDLVVALTTSQPTLVSVPATVTVPKNNLTATFPITVNNVASKRNAACGGDYGYVGGCFCDCTADTSASED